MGRHSWWLCGVLLCGALLRLPALWWGLPPAIPHVIASDIRCSYAFDEDDLLTAVSFSDASKGDFDPRDYHWGTLHLHLLQFWMGAAETAGVFGRAWRDAYYNMTSGAFETVYAAGRLLSVAMALLSIALVFLLGRQAAGPSAGLWAAALVAVSPTHLLASTQIRADITMLTLVVLALWLGVRSLNSGSSKTMVWMAAVCGMAMAAKYTAALTLIPAALVVLTRRRARAAEWALAACTAAAGFVVGEPYAVAKPQEVFQSAYQVFQANASPPPRFAVSVPMLLARHGLNAARFSLGPAALLLALWGLVWMVRKRSAASLVILAALLGSIAAWIPLAWPLLRYQLPLLPLLAVAAAFGLMRFQPPARVALGALALAFPLFASLAQFAYMRSTHPANQALRLILQETPPGASIARLAAELPPLDRKIYPMGPNPFLDDISSLRPEWVLTADLPEQAYPAANLEALKIHYELLGAFDVPRAFAWASLGESAAPHDWKYTHPRMALYRRRGR